MRVFDGHSDALQEVHLFEPEKARDFLKRGKYGHLDLPRAIEGGFGGGFFAVFVPPHPEKHRWTFEGALKFTEDGYKVQMPPAMELPYAQDMAGAMLETLFRIEKESNGRLKIARNLREVEDCLRADVLAAVIHFEGAEPINENLEALEDYYNAGLRSLGIVWSRPNIFGCGVPFRFPCSPNRGPGLTEAGKRLVKACNDMGIIVDCAHLNERGFFDVSRITEKPLVVTHSAAHALTPSARNLTDRQLDAVGDSGGIVGVTFFVGDVRPDGGFDADTPIELIARHTAYIAERIGVDHVALGSDFDGARIPAEMGDVAGLPKLIFALREKGFNEDELTKIARRNWLRIMKEAW